MPPSISIEAAADDSNGGSDPNETLPPKIPSPIRTPSSDSTQRGFSSLDTDRDVETPILDEFAQYVNASIHPPNELSVPRCYPNAGNQPSPTSPTWLASPLTAPNSRRSSKAGLLSPDPRYHRSHSLGHSNKEGINLRPSRSVGGTRRASPAMSPCRPQLRRESAQDLGDGDVPGNKANLSLGSAGLVSRLQISINPPITTPDLKIDLLSEHSSPSRSNSPYSPSGRNSSATTGTNSQGGMGVLLGAPGDVRGLRRHSHNLRVTPNRNKSAPVTPLNRSTTNVNAHCNTS